MAVLVTYRGGGNVGKGVGGRTPVGGLGPYFPHIAVQGSGCGSPIIREPGILDGTFGILVLVLELLDVKIDLLGSSGATMTPLQPVQRDSQCDRPLTPGPFRIDGPQGVSWLGGDFVRTGQGDREFPVNRGFSGKQPYLLAYLDGISLIPITLSGPLEGTSEVFLNFVVSMPL